MKKKYVQDLPMVVSAEAEFVGLVGAAEAAPECYAALGRNLSDLAQARDGEEFRALSAARWEGVKAVRAYGPSGVDCIDSAFGRMEEAAEAAGEAKRSRR